MSGAGPLQAAKAPLGAAQYTQWQAWGLYD